MICIECKSDKIPDEFYAHKKMASGRVNVCKDCHKERMRIRRRTNPSVQEYERKRSKTPERREMARNYSKAWREKNPQGYKAHSLVGSAVALGRLKRLPCEFCSAEEVHAHHKDYSKPLDVIWLCAKCHHRLHAIFPELEGVGKVAAGG